MFDKANIQKIRYFVSHSCVFYTVFFYTYILNICKLKFAPLLHIISRSRDIKNYTYYKFFLRKGANFRKLSLT